MHYREPKPTFLTGLVEALCWGSLIGGGLALVIIRIGIFK